MDAALLKGSVPSPAEWTAAWAVLAEGISLRTESRVFDTKIVAFASVMNIRRERHRQHFFAMTEVLIRKIRKALLQGRLQLW